MILSFEDAAATRINYFNQIGSDSSNIILKKDFVKQEDLLLMQEYLYGLPDTDEEFYGPLDLRTERIEKENQFVADIIKKYEQKVFDCVEAHFIKKYNIPIKRIPINDPHFVKWIPGMRSKLHADCEKPDGSPAIYAGFNRLNISCLIYINDNYVGGAINFPNQNFYYQPVAGDLIIFPGNNNFQHEVTEIVSGKRYTMPSWYCFDIDEELHLPPERTKESLLTNSKQLWDNNAGKVES